MTRAGSIVRFVSVDEAAALCRLEENDQWGVCIYPRAKTWGQFHGDPELLKRLRQVIVEGGEGWVVAVIGPPGTGKTCHLLLLGHWWEEQESSRQSFWLLSQPRRLAFYGVASALDLEVVMEQWEGLRGEECLWLVDDMHTNIDICVSLVKAYQDLKLVEQGHSLVFVGWAMPRHIAKVVTIPVCLTLQTIQNAFSTKGLSVPAPGVLESLANTAVGLQRILWYAQRQPELLANPTLLQIGFATDATQGLTIIQQSLLMRLSRLRFLGVRLPINGDKMLWRQLQELSGKGLVSEDTASNTWEIPDDERARALLILDLEISNTRVATSDLVGKFLNPLKQPADWFTSMGSARFLRDLLAALRARTRGDLYTWFSLELSNGDRSLLKEFLEDTTCVSNLKNILETSSLSTADIVRTLYTIGKAEKWVGEVANTVLDSRLAELQSQISAGELQAWQAGELLSRLSGNKQLNDVLSQALCSPRLLSTIVDLPPVERGVVLLQIQSFSPSGYQTVMRNLMPAVCGELAKQSPMAFWRRLYSIAHLDRDIAVEVLTSLDISLISEAGLKEPHYMRKFLATFNPKQNLEQRRKICNILCQSLAESSVTERHAATWTSSRDIISFIDLSLELGLPKLLEADIVKEAAEKLLDTDNPAVVVDLCNPVAKSASAPLALRISLADKLEKTITDGKEPLNERIHALTQLDRSRVIPLIREMLYNTQGIPSDPRHIFWLLWNVLVALPEEEQAPLLILVEQVIKQWDSIFAGTNEVFILLALSGLCAFIYRGLPPIVSLRLALEQGVPGIQPSSPILTVCQLYTLSKTMVNNQDVEYQYLEWLAESLKEPSKQFHKRWHNLMPRSRRIVLRILFDGLTALYGRSETQGLASGLIRAIASEKLDDICDSYLMLRLKMVLYLAGEDSACELLTRRAEKWIKVVPNLPEPIPAEFIRVVGNLSGRCPSAKTQVLQEVRSQLTSSSLSTRARYVLEQIERLLGGQLTVQ